MANPKLRFKEFIEPWETKPLNSVFSLFSGFAFPSSASCDSGVRWLKISDVGIQAMVCSNPSYLPHELKEKYPEFIVNKDEYVIALTRPILNKQLKLAKVGGIYDGALLNQRVAKLISKSSNVDFVYFLLQKSDIIELLANSIAGSDPPNLSLSEIKNINLTIPRIEEQTKIANFLTAVDGKISQLNEQHQLMIQYKKGVMQKIFSQEIRFKDDNGEDFGEWEERILEDVSIIIMGSSPKSENYNELGIGLPLLQGNADIKDRRSYPRNFTTEITKECDVGDILMSVRAPVGYVAKAMHNACIGRGIAAIRVKENNNQEFLYQYLIYIEDIWGKFSQGSTFDSVNSEQIRNLSIFIPCLQEQTKIADFFTKLDDKIEKLALQLEQVKMWKKGLLQQIFV